MCCRLWEHNDKASRRNYQKLCTQSRNAKEDASPANRSARRVCSRPLLLRLRLLLVLLLLPLRLRAHRPRDDPPSPRRAHQSVRMGPPTQWTHFKASKIHRINKKDDRKIDFVSCVYCFLNVKGPRAGKHHALNRVEGRRSDRYQTHASQTQGHSQNKNNV